MKLSGSRLLIKVLPATDVVNIINRSKTVGAEETKDITIERQHGSNNIIIEGTVPVGGTVTREWIAIWEPSYYALDLFKKSLEEKGIQFVGKSKTRWPRRQAMLNFWRLNTP